jgi:hypothetical protein
MLKAFVIAASLTVAAAPVSASDVTPPPIDPYAGQMERCIRDNAAKVESSIADLTQAADFLVNKVCAVPLAQAAAERVRQTRLRLDESWQKLCDEQTAAKADAKPDAKPAEDYCRFAKNGLVDQRESFDGWSDVGFPTTAPPAAVALASQLLVSLRAAHKHHDN